MFKRFSHKDLLLILGIIVAAVIALTTMVYSEHPSEAATPVPVSEKTSSLFTPAVIIKKLVESVGRVSADYNSSAVR